MQAVYNFLAHNQLLNSNLFIAAATLIVGFAAFFLYKKQKRDEKKDAATILLTELRAVSAILPGLKTRFKANVANALEEGVFLMASESWSKYKYLFVNDLNGEEWRAVDTFYSKCQEYDRALSERQSYFSQNTGQIWVSIHKNYQEQLAEYLKEEPAIAITEDARGKIFEIPSELAERISAFTDTYIANSYQLAGYEPGKSQNEVTRALESINDDLLLSSVGKRLNEIANPRIFRIRRR
jgi:hypothetical protein